MRRSGSRLAIRFSPNKLSARHKMALARVIQRAPGLSRAELAKETGLTKSTVSLLVQDLINEGWLFESGVQATGSMGRRPTPLFLDGVRLAMIGAEVSVETQSISALTVSLTGDVINECTQKFLQEGNKIYLTKPFSLGDFRSAINQALTLG